MLDKSFGANQTAFMTLNIEVINLFSYNTIFFLLVHRRAVFVVKDDFLSFVTQLALQQGAGGCTWVWWWSVELQCRDLITVCGAVQNHPENPPSESALKSPVDNVCPLKTQNNENSRVNWLLSYIQIQATSLLRLIVKLNFQI